MSLLEVRDLSVSFKVEGGTLSAVRNVSFDIERGETLALVGESGSGKSVTALSILQLLPYPKASHPSGSIRLDGRELIGADEATLRQVRGDRVGIIFQEPMTSLNPSLTVGDQIVETLLRHRGGTRRQAREHAIGLLRRVHIASPEKRIDEYPHKLSGGMRQRVMIAMALACDPQLLIADEPTTALDVTLQAQILDLMRELKAASNAAIILITHDLGVVAEVCDEVAVMYAGEIVERSPELGCVHHLAHRNAEQFGREQQLLGAGEATAVLRNDRDVVGAMHQRTTRGELDQRGCLAGTRRADEARTKLGIERPWCRRRERCERLFLMRCASSTTMPRKPSPPSQPTCRSSSS